MGHRLPVIYERLPYPLASPPSTSTFSVLFKASLLTTVPKFFTRNISPIFYYFIKCSPTTSATINLRFRVIGHRLTQSPIQ